MTNKSGQCLCGKVQYKISGLPISQGICYCLQCQRSGGTFGSPLIVVLHKAFDCSQENLSSYKTKSNRGSIVTRNFCRECGSHIYSQISDVPEIVTVKVATFDDTSDFAPQYLVWVRSAPPSCTFPKDVPSFQENAPMEMLLSLGRASF